VGLWLYLWLFQASRITLLFASSGCDHPRQKTTAEGCVHMGCSVLVASSAGRRCRGMGVLCVAGVGVSRQIKLSEVAVCSAGSCRVSSAENSPSAPTRRKDLCAAQFPLLCLGGKQ